jgi:hypothetical protein
LTRLLQLPADGSSAKGAAGLADPPARVLLQRRPELLLQVRRRTGGSESWERGLIGGRVK